MQVAAARSPRIFCRLLKESILRRELTATAFHAQNKFYETAHCFCKCLNPFVSLLTKNGQLEDLLQTLQAQSQKTIEFINRPESATWAPRIGTMRTGGYKLGTRMKFQSDGNNLIFHGNNITLSGNNRVIEGFRAGEIQEDTGAPLFDNAVRNSSRPTIARCTADSVPNR